MGATNCVWAFDLGKGSIGEAVRLDNQFLQQASLLVPARFAEIKPAPGRRRMWRTRISAQENCIVSKCRHVRSDAPSCAEHPRPHSGHWVAAPHRLPNSISTFFSASIGSTVLISRRLPNLVTIAQPSPL